MHPPWHDYTLELKELRENFERQIRDYIYPADPSRQWKPPVIVAPFGSGKTTLLRHLAWYSWSKLRVPALIIELKEIAERITSKNQDIYEVTKQLFEDYLRIIKNEVNRGYLSNGKELLGIVHDKCSVKILEENLGISPSDVIEIIDHYLEHEEAKGVLLLDEIEESYDQLKQKLQLVCHPLRALVDRALNRYSKFALVMAYGPQSILQQESPTQWRCIIYRIPVIYSHEIKELLAREGINVKLDRRIINTLWWVSKGRIGWIGAIVKNAELIKLLEATSNCRSLNEMTKLVDSFFNHPALSEGKIIEGVPLISKEIYQEFINSDEIPESIKDLLVLTMIFTGPISIAELEKYLSIDWSKVPAETHISYGPIVEVSTVIRAIRKFIKSNIQEQEPYNLKQELYVDEVTSHVLSSIEHVLDALSVEKNGVNYVLLDSNYLKQVFEIASFIYSEIYSKIEGLEKIDSLVNSAERIVFYIKRNKALKSDHIALNPHVVTLLYPLVISTVLIGSAAEFKNKPHELFTYLRKSLIDKGKLFEYSEKFQRLLGLKNENIELLFIPVADATNDGKIVGKILEKEFVNRLYNEKKFYRFYIIPLGLGEDIVNTFKKEIKNDKEYLFELKIISFADEGFSKLLRLFTAGLLYELIKKGRIDTSEYKGIEKRLYIQFMSQLLENIRRISSYNESKRQKLSKEYLNYLSKFRDIHERYVPHSIGSGQARIMAKTVYNSDFSNLLQELLLIIHGIGSIPQLKLLIGNQSKRQVFYGIVSLLSGTGGKLYCQQISEIAQDIYPRVSELCSIMTNIYTLLAYKLNYDNFDELVNEVEEISSKIAEGLFYVKDFPVLEAIISKHILDVTFKTNLFNHTIVENYTYSIMEFEKTKLRSTIEETNKIMLNIQQYKNKLGNIEQISKLLDELIKLYAGLSKYLNQIGLLYGKVKEIFGLDDIYLMRNAYTLLLSSGRVHGILNDLIEGIKNLNNVTREYYLNNLEKIEKIYENILSSFEDLSVVLNIHIPEGTVIEKEAVSTINKRLLDAHSIEEILNRLEELLLELEKINKKYKIIKELSKEYEQKKASIYDILKAYCGDIT